MDRLHLTTTLKRIAQMVRKSGLIKPFQHCVRIHVWFNKACVIAANTAWALSVGSSGQYKQGRRGPWPKGAEHCFVEGIMTFSLVITIEAV